jgi:diguanylate cyclase (GGDEF)-like protein
MNSQEALVIVRNILSPHSLNLIQELVFTQSWMQKTYQEMAQDIGYDSHYLKQIGSELWKALSNVIQKRVTKKNLQLILEDYLQVSGLQVSERSIPAMLDPPPDPVPVSPGTISGGGKIFELHTALEWEGFINCLQQTWNHLQAEAVCVLEFASSLASLSLLVGELDDASPLQAVYSDSEWGSNLRDLMVRFRRQLRRPTDRLIFIAPNQFMVLLPQTESKGAIHVAEQMRATLKEYVGTGKEIMAHSLDLTLSLGVSAIVPDLDSTPAQLLAMANLALQQAKAAGGDRVVLLTG